MGPWRVLVVDDLAVNRHALSTLLEADGRAIVVGRASDGAEAMRLLKEQAPDVITLDLEMPRMDGFTFLRLVPGVRPTPVIVVSTDSRPHSVFQALELGALDFVVKPKTGDISQATEAGRELREKVLVAAEFGGRARSTEPLPERESTGGFRASGITCVAVAASTGGPPVVQKFLEAFTEPPPFSVIVAQHMPPRFTEALAERLRKHIKLPIGELRQAEPILRGRAYICPGGLVTSIKSLAGHTIARITPATTERYTPSADALFTSVAEAHGPEAAAVVFTGMGNDGAAGAKMIARGQGRVFVEEPSRATLPTMPQAAMDACPRARVMTHEAIIAYFASAARALATARPPLR
ncbi:MAG: chemotaxis protein CheB [Deltaproteobacteria bacterium]|nr:chemotaxis protein CheB [Deltaproteobacteria bacterium]